ncbi:MAG: type II secretion system GspH family protein [Planctomycetota bacterium]|jgi:prepilin-type N-terminal cleavage/methylation domain-containing protein|nr:type II secretion system GspH family protein [Planctomycetota bacterium]
MSRSSFSRRGNARREAGFNLIELTIVLVVLGVMGFLAGSAFSGADTASSASKNRARAKVVYEAVRYFALANKRFPCPDQSGDGYEECEGRVEFGFVPYVTLGLENMMEMDPVYYAVYRGTNDNSDLAVLAERGDDTEGQIGYKGYGDLIQALEGIPTTLDPTNHVRVAAVSADGTSDCSNATHPAFVVMVPGAVGKDGENVTNWGDSPYCVASPIQSGTSSYDDFVLAESPVALAEWLFKHHVP